MRPSPSIFYSSQSKLATITPVRVYMCSGFTRPPNLHTEPILLEKLAMSAQFAPEEESPLDSEWYRMTAFGLNLTPNSQLCPENNCQFGFEVGESYSGYFCK